MARRCSVERANKQIGGFASAKKNMVIQYEGRERSTKHLLELIHDDVLTKGVAEEEIEQLDIYVKPEEQAVYYVVNQKIEARLHSKRMWDKNVGKEENYGNGLCNCKPEGRYW